MPQLQREVNVRLTADQCRYLHLGPSADGAIVPQGDLTITAVDVQGDNMILVEQTKNVGEEGSGVWVNARGQEMYG